jgi:hypothetical protein
MPPFARVVHMQLRAGVHDWGCYVKPNTPAEEVQTVAAQKSAMGYFTAGPEAWRKEAAFSTVIS